MPRGKWIRLFMMLTVVNLSAMATTSSAQSRNRDKPAWGYGLGVIYNFQTEGFGGEVRMRIPLLRRLYAVPEFSYFPSFNEYHEYYAGAALQYDILTLGGYNLYLHAGGYYNNWINAEDFAYGPKKEQNVVAEAGGGLVRNNGCIRPFIENRYDFKWKEDNLRIGIYIYPGACIRKEKCPAYDNY